VENRSICAEAVRQLFECFPIPESEQFIVAARAAAAQYRFATMFFLLAAISSLRVFVFVFVLQLLLPATTGMVGALLRRTTAAGAIPYTQPGDGVSDDSGLGRESDKGTDCHHAVNCYDYQGDYLVRKFFHTGAGWQKCLSMFGTGTNVLPTGAFYGQRLHGTSSLPTRCDQETSSLKTAGFFYILLRHSHRTIL
jgi:hypothetical protein